MNVLNLLFKIVQFIIKWEPLADQLIVALEQLFHDIEQHPAGTVKVTTEPIVAPTRNAQSKPSSIPVEKTLSKAAIQLPKIDLLPSQKPPTGSQLEKDLEDLKAIALYGTSETTDSTKNQISKELEHQNLKP